MFVVVLVTTSWPLQTDRLWTGHGPRILSRTCRSGRYYIGRSEPVAWKCLRMFGCKQSPSCNLTNFDFNVHERSEDTLSRFGFRLLYPRVIVSEFWRMSYFLFWRSWLPLVFCVLSFKPIFPFWLQKYVELVCQRFDLVLRPLLGTQSQSMDSLQGLQVFASYCSSLMRWYGMDMHVD